MGISGLLPLLKQIQVHKHLSEFSGQTLAVDAYVWLHRGVYACAADIATGRKTSKYVDYAMHRVRLLRHHRIQAYVVFDGGHLPAKKGTELERRQKREENVARGHALAAQGRHLQAREFYAKCVDVTPQMAFQLIKALRAECVPYVVAPYEADAQLAYLERMGLVDGIITEDSDLLVFGCKNVLFKLDAVASTVTCISRSDFAALTTSESGISLLGWSDVQFRAMAILSGCDYLPSIAGIGLKTAWSLLRKHKTVENVLRALRFEGKKDIPKQYLQAFKLAEKVFLHQRVYDPVEEKLVHMTQVPDAEMWDEETEAYVGIDIEPSLARKVALGDVDPTTFVPMEDINPAYVPRVVKSLQLVSNAINRYKNDEPPKRGSLLNFFAPQPRAPLPPINSSQHSKGKIVVGQASGKRTLADVMEQDLAAKRKKSDEPKSRESLESRFFGASSSLSSSKKSAHHHLQIDPESLLEAGPSHIRAEKENVPMDFNISMEVGLEFEDPVDPVTQEDGYLSPSPACPRWETPELSSPVQPKSTRSRSQDDFGADPISSPLAARSANSRARSRMGRPRSASPSYIRSPEHPERGRKRKGGLVRETRTNDEFVGPDLRDMFGDDTTSDIDSFEGERQDGDQSSCTPSPPGPVTPDDGCHAEIVESRQTGVELDRDINLGLEQRFDDPMEMEKRSYAMRSETVAIGWREKWALQGRAETQPMLKRHETTVIGHHRVIRPPSHPYRVTNPGQPKLGTGSKTITNVRRRKSLIFFKEGRKGMESSQGGGGYPRVGLRPRTPCDFLEDEDEALTIAQSKLAQFRCRAG